MTDLSGIADRLKAWAGKDLKVRLIVVAGLLGMLLILAGQFTDRKQERASPERQQALVSTEISGDEYALWLEQRLLTIISSIDGVGQVEVMVTLEHGEEYIYAQEEKSSTDRSTAAGEDGVTGAVDYRKDVEYSYVFVDSGYGEKQPLVRTLVPPKVQGVVIVCEGADSVIVEQSLTHVVTTALNIPTTRVCVVKINADYSG